MGEAKRRGTYRERKVAAIAKYRQEMNEKIPMQRIYPKTRITSAMAAMLAISNMAQRGKK